MNDRRRLILIGLVLIAVALTYANHYENDFHFDDHHTIVNNPAIRSLSNITKIFTDVTQFSTFPPNQSFRPLVTSILALDFAMGPGLYPIYFHLSTMFAFLLQLLVMGLLFEHILGKGYRAWLGVALYGLHPVCAETVNYMCQRADLYVGLFLSLGLLGYVRKNNGLAYLSFFLGCLSKQSGVVFPGILVAYEFFLGEKKYRRLIPYLVLGTAVIGMHAYIKPETYLVGANGANYQYRLTQPYLAMLYIFESVAPIYLAADNEMVPFDNILHPDAVLGYVGLLIVVYLMFRGKNPVISFGLAWFLIVLSPTSLVPLGDVTNDHRMFGPFIGLALIAAELAKYSRIRTVLILALPFLAYGTYLRNEVWKTDERLWRDTIAKRPRNARAWLNLGVTVLGENRAAEAYVAMQQCKEFEQDYIYLELNLGICCMHLKRWDEAEHHYIRATHLDPGGSPLYSYAIFLYQRNRVREAIPLFVESNRRNPRDLKAIHRLTYIFDQELAKCRAKPTAANYTNYSVLLCLAQDFRQATSAARIACQIDPKNAFAHNTLAGCLIATRDWKAAASEASRALELNPKLEVARRNLQRAKDAMATRK